VDEHLLSP